MSRVLLKDIQRLTLYKGEKTTSRRLSPVPQLTCVGSSCKLFQPEVVRCYNDGGEGTEVDWNCEADLPAKLRFGRVDVSCEGWSKPGDPYVVKGSCGLTYQLVRISDPGERPQDGQAEGFAYYFFCAVSIAIAGFILYTILRGCCGRNRTTGTPNESGPSESSYLGRADAPPPPYSPHDSKYNTFNPQQSSNADFLRGAAVGAAGGAAALAAAQALHRGLHNPGYSPYDWERRDHHYHPPLRTRRSHSPNRGEGSSGLGELRSSTGFATSSVR